MDIWIIIRDKIRKIDDRPQTDMIDATTYVKYHGISRLNLTTEEKQELLRYVDSDEIAGGIDGEI